MEKGKRETSICNGAEKTLTTPMRVERSHTIRGYRRAGKRWGESSAARSAREIEGERQKNATGGRRTYPSAEGPRTLRTLSAGGDEKVVIDAYS